MLAIASIYTIVLTIASFMNIKNLPKVGFSFDDKIYHFLAYTVLGILWIYYCRKGISGKHIRWFLAFLLIYGIIVEVLQQEINPLRTFDIYDLIANCLGVLFGAFVAKKLTKSKVKINS